MGDLLTHEEDERIDSRKDGVSFRLGILEIVGGACFFRSKA